MSTWAESFELIHAALSTVSGLVELPSAAVASVPLTMTKQGNIGYSLFFDSTGWTNDRQRKKVRVAHGVTLGLVAMTRQTQRESETLAAMLDLEQTILTVLFERGIVPTGTLLYIGTSRRFSSARDYLETSMSFTLSMTDDTGAN